MIFRRKWEVYRVVPESWKLTGFSEHPYWRCRTRKRAERMAADCDWTLRGGRSDEDFAAFKVRRRDG